MKNKTIFEGRLWLGVFLSVLILGLPRSGASALGTCDLTKAGRIVVPNGSSVADTPASVFAPFNILLAGEIITTLQDCADALFSKYNCDGGTLLSYSQNQFWCQYTSPGTYHPSLKITNASGSYTPSLTVFVPNAAEMVNCAANTCKGHSCWNGSKYVNGNKVDGCATVKVQANPLDVYIPGKSCVTWTSKDAVRMESECESFSIFNINRWAEFLSSDDCIDAGTIPGCDSGTNSYLFDFNTLGVQYCMWFPFNASDGLLGIPSGVNITVEAGHTCADDTCIGQTCMDAHSCTPLKGTKNCCAGYNTVPGGGTACPGDTMNVSTDGLAWKDIGNSGACTFWRKCEYYMPPGSGKCSPSYDNQTLATVPDDDVICSIGVHNDLTKIVGGWTWTCTGTNNIPISCSASEVCQGVCVPIDCTESDCGKNLNRFRCVPNPLCPTAPCSSCDEISTQTCQCNSGNWIEVSP